MSDHADAMAIPVAGREVHRMGFGAMRIMGAPDPHALVRRAVELGVQFIDSADIYGDGASERIIAEALHPYPPEVLIATKGGFVPGKLRPGERALPARSAQAGLRGEPRAPPPRADRPLPAPHTRPCRAVRGLGRRPGGAA